MNTSKNMPVEMKSRIQGIMKLMLKFHCYFGINLAYFILKITDNLATKIQDPNLNATEAYVMGMDTIKTLQDQRTDEKFENFLNGVIESAEEKGVENPTMPRKRKLTGKMEDYFQGGKLPEYSTINEMYQAAYNKAIDTMISNLDTRFNSEGHKRVMSLENLLFKSAKGEDYQKEFKEVIEKYESDLDKHLLGTQLLTFSAKCKNELTEAKIVLHDIVELMRKNGSSALLSEVSTVLKLILVLPATNAECERCFSALKRIKTYLRNSMSQKRLSDMMVLNIHEEETEDLDLIQIANEFSVGNDRRKYDFGDRKFV